MSAIHKAGHIARNGRPHTLTASRAAQIHRWQMLGAAARKGKGKAQRSAHHSASTKARRSVAAPLASAAKWGVAKVVLPTSLVTPFVPGYQPGDRGFGSTRKKRR